MSASNQEAAYFSSLASTYEANPQDIEALPPPPVQRKQRTQQAWFGPNPVLENLEVVTQSEASSSQLTVEDTFRLAALENKINNLCVTTIVSQQMTPYVDDMKKVSDAIVQIENHIKVSDRTNAIRINKVVKGFGDALDIVRKKERRRRKKSQDFILIALNNINAKLGIPTINDTPSPEQAATTNSDPQSSVPPPLPTLPPSPPSTKSPPSDFIGSTNPPVISQASGGAK